MTDPRIDRRSFLAGLLSFGAVLRLPQSVAAATPAEIDDAWEDLLKDPWILKVSDQTIVDPSVPEPETWGDVFDHVSGLDPAWEVDSCPPLLAHVQQCVEDVLPPIAKSIRRQADRASGKDRSRLLRLARDLEHPDEGWKAWIEVGGPHARETIREIIQAWLQEPVDWGQADWFPVDFGSQGEVYRYFSTMPLDICEELGVVIVEGDRPGSTYFAAELRQSIPDANRAAARLGLPFRFA